MTGFYMIGTPVMKELGPSMPPLPSSLQFFDNFLDTPFIRSKDHYNFHFLSFPLSLFYCFFFSICYPAIYCFLYLLNTYYISIIYPWPINTELRCFSSLKAKRSISLPPLRSGKLCLFLTQSHSQYATSRRDAQPEVS